MSENVLRFGLKKLRPSAERWERPVRMVKLGSANDEWVAVHGRMGAACRLIELMGDGLVRGRDAGTWIERSSVRGRIWAFKFNGKAR